MRAFDDALLRAQAFLDSMKSERTRVAEAREVLKFYADDANYVGIECDPDKSPIDDDGGMRAKEWLEKNK